MKEIRSFVMMWLGLETGIQNEIRKGKTTSCVNAYRWNRDDGTAEPICQAGMETKL